MGDFRKTDYHYFGVYFPTRYKWCIIQAIHLFLFHFCMEPNPWLDTFFQYSIYYSFTRHPLCVFFFFRTRRHLLQDANVLGRVLGMNSFVEQKISFGLCDLFYALWGTHNWDRFSCCIVDKLSTESLPFTEIIYIYDRRHNYGYAFFVCNMCILSVCVMNTMCSEYKSLKLAPTH